MTPDPHPLLLSLLSQAVMTTVLGAMLYVFHRQYHHTYLRHWAFSWWADALSILAGAAGTGEFWGTSPSPAVKLGFTALSQCAIYLHLSLLLLGARELVTARTTPSRSRLLLFLGAIAVGITAAVTFAFDPSGSMRRLLLRAGLHTAVSGLAFCGVAIAIARDGWTTSVGRRFLVATMGCFGAGQLFYAYATAAIALGMPGPPAIAYHGTFDTVLVALIGFSMIGTLLEEERDRAQTRAEEALRAERALREQEMRFRSLIENATDIITIMELDGRIRYESPSVTRVLGWKPEELVGRNAMEYVHPDDLATVAEELSRDLSNPDHLGSAIFRFRHRDGSYRVLDGIGRVLQEPDGSVTLLINSRDITDRTVAEQARRHSEERLALHVSQTPLGIIEWGLDFRVRDWNPAAAAIFGWTREEAIGQLGTFIIPASARTQTAEVWQELVTNRGGIRSTNANLRRDGQLIECEWYNTPLTGAAGEVMAIASFVQDVTEKRRMEQHLVQAQRLESIGRLAGGVAHDFNNLLTAIFAHSHELRATVPDDASMRGEVEGIQAAADRAAALTRQLLAFARRQVVQPRPLSVNDLVLGLVQMLRRLLGEHIELITLTEPDIGPVLADPGQLEQVVVNLVVNARDAMPEGGRLTVETGAFDLDEPSRIFGIEVAAGRYATLSVSDSGAGIPAEVRDHIYEPFYTTKGPGQGTGLGLATCYGIVSQHGGYIWFETEEGRGTRFTVCLPLANEAIAADAAGPGRPQKPGRETILLVEDELAVRALAERTLRSGGYSVIQAPDGEAALALVQERERVIDCIVTDIVMPRMGGVGLAERALALRPGTPVLFTSGYASESAMAGPLQGPGVGFLAKPFTPEALLRSVRELLDAVGSEAR